MVERDNPFILAPMAGICDLPFRRLMKHLRAGCVVSEFVSAHGMLRGGPKFKKYLAVSEHEHPMGIQIFGHEAEVLAEASKIIEQKGADFVDINLGCPVPKVTKKGGGSAWLCYPVELAKMLDMVAKAISIPLTIKIRTGWDDNSVNAHEIAQIAYDNGVQAVAVHGRTRAQGYAGYADWNFIKELATAAIIPIVGNGDVISGSMAVARLYESGCDAVMIGRGALKNPWIFQEAEECYEQTKSFTKEQKEQWAIKTLEEYNIVSGGQLPTDKHYYQKKVKSKQPKPLDLSAKMIQISKQHNAEELVETHLEYLRDFYNEERVPYAFKKFLAWYASGYPGANQFRKFIFTTEDFSAVLDRTYQFFDEVKKLGEGVSKNRDMDPVLMSGHG